MTKHPEDRGSRRRVTKKKSNVRTEESFGRIWRRLSKEHAKEKETEDDLRDALG